MPFVGSLLTKPDVFHLIKNMELSGVDDVMDRDSVYYRHLLVFGKSLICSTDVLFVIDHMYVVLPVAVYCICKHIIF